jgi:GT2 family glycosyltransferase
MTDPAVSIIVPTYGRLPIALRCLEAIHAHTLDTDYEIVLLDNGSKPRGFVWTANRGLKAAVGDAIIIVADDIVVQPGWLPPLLEALSEGCWAASSTHLDDQGNLSADNFPLNSSCIAFSRHGYEQSGGYDARYTHWLCDSDLFTRLDDAGAPYVRSDASQVQHLREPQPTDPELIETMRAWHLNDYGHGPGSW